MNVFHIRLGYETAGEADLKPRCSCGHDLAVDEEGIMSCPYLSSKGQPVSDGTIKTDNEG